MTRYTVVLLHSRKDNGYFTTFSGLTEAEATEKIGLLFTNDRYFEGKVFPEPAVPVTCGSASSDNDGAVPHDTDENA